MRVKEGRGAYLFLEDGRKLIDMISSWWVTLHGHAHPKIADAIASQAKKLEQVIFANFIHEPARKLVDKLHKYLPIRLSHFFFSDNGSTAVEVALKMAFQYWKNIGRTCKEKYISFEGAYHGDTIGAMSVGQTDVFQEIFHPLFFQTDRVPFPYTYEGDNHVEEKEKYSLEVLDKLLEKNKDQYAAIIIEPLLQGGGGMRLCRSEFLKKLSLVANENEIILIYDEILTGFGRIGDWFACTQSDTIPDIICLSKGLTGGFMPLALTVCTEKIYQAFYSDELLKTFFHSHSYTANPIACSAALASLELLEETKPFEQYHSLHRLLLKPFQTNSKVKRIRTLGTMAAMDIVSEGKEGYTNPIGKSLQRFLFDKGIYLRPLGNTIYLLPPYCVTAKELHFVYQAIEEGLDTMK